MEKLNLFIKYFSARGGGEQKCYDFLTYLQARGYPFEIYCGRDKTKGRSPFARYVHTIPFVSGTRLLKYWSFYRSGSNIAKRTNGTNFSFDRILNIDVFRTGGGSHRAFLKKSLSGYQGSSKFLKRFRRAADPVNRFIIATEKKVFTSTRLKALIVNSKMARAEICTFYPQVEDKIHVIHNGVDKEIFHFSKTTGLRERKRKEFGITGKKVIGFASNNFERKGLIYLIHSLVDLPEEFVLLIAGKGSKTKYEFLLKKLDLTHRVHFLGDIQQMDTFYPCLDLFCFPSLYDPFASVVPEALAMGIPVVSSAYNGSSELIEKDVNGQILPCLDPVRIAYAIRKAAALGVHDYGAKILSLETMYDRYLELALSS